MHRILALLLLVTSGNIGIAAASQHIIDSLRSIYYDVQPAGNFYIVNQGALSTVFNSSGQPMFPFKYSSIVPGLNDCFIAQGTLLIDSNGEQHHRFTYSITSVNQQRQMYVIQLPDRVDMYDADGKMISSTANNVTRSEFYTAPSNDGSGKQVIKDTFGNQLLPDAYDGFSFGKKYFGATRNDSFFAFTRTGRFLFNCRADGGQVFPNDFIAAHAYCLWALLDTTGRNITPYKYFEVKYENRDDVVESGVIVIDRTGKEVAASGGEMNHEHSGNWMTIGFNGDIVDENFKMVFKKGSYEDADFIGNRFIVFDKDRQGPKERVYDRVTKKYVSFMPTEALPNEAYLLEDKNNRKSIFKNGKILALPPFTKLENNYRQDYYEIEFSEHTGKYFDDIFDRGNKIELTNDTYGILDKDMNLIVPIRYSSVSRVCNTLYYLATETDKNMTAEKSTLYDSKGKIVEKMEGRVQVQCIGPLARIDYASRTMLIDSTGIFYNKQGVVSLLYPNRSEEHQVMPRLLAITDSTGGTGIYTIRGKLLQPHLYHLVEEKAKGIVSLKKGDSLYFIDYKGRLLFGGRGFEGRTCRPLAGMAMLLQRADGKWGVLDANCRELLPFLYDTMYRDAKNNYMLGKDKQYTMLENTGMLQRAAEVQSVTSAPVLSIENKIWKLAAESRELFVVRREALDGIPAGIYNNRGRYLVSHAKDVPTYGFVVGSDRRQVQMVGDSTGKRAAVIDTSGRFIVPYIDKPDILVLNQYAVVAVYRNSPDLLFRINGDSVLRIEIKMDSADKAGILKDGRSNKFMNNTNMMYSMSGRTGRGIIFSYAPVLWETDADSITNLHELYYIRKKSGWGLMDKRGGWICPAICDSIRYNRDKLILYKGRKRGVYDMSARMCVPPVFDTVYNSYTGRKNFYVVKDNGRFMLVNRKQEPLTQTFDSISTRQWSSLHKILAYNDGKTYQISVTHNAVIVVEPDEAAPIKLSLEGYYAPVVIAKENGKAGLFSNKEHRWLVPPIYAKIMNKGRDDNYIAWKYKGRWGGKADSTFVFDRDGVRLLALAEGYLPSRYAGDLWMLNDYYPPVGDSKGRIIVPDSFSHADIFGDVLMVRTDNKYGGDYGLISRTGKRLLPPIFSDFEQPGAGFLAGGIFNYRRLPAPHRAYCLISPAGKMLTDTIYATIDLCKNTGSNYTLPIFTVSIDTLSGIIDSNGKVMIPCQYRAIHQVYQYKLVIAQNRAGKYGILSLKGKQIVPFAYDMIDPMVSDLATFKRGDTSGWLDVNGKEQLQ